MRLGAPVFTGHDDPEAYAQAHLKKGYRAAYCPNGLSLANPEAVTAFRDTFEKHDILFAEVGAWCNPTDADPVTAAKNIEFIAERLSLADELGAVCCVNIVGSACTDNWFGPAAANYTADFFDLAVQAARRVIDLAKPKRAKMSFEMVPYNFIDSPAEALRFVQAIERDAAGIHVDFTNCINSPRLYYHNTDSIRSQFELLGDRILSAHCKDIRLHNDEMSVVMAEVPIGFGNMDYVTLLKLGAKLPADTPFMLEHLPDEEAYDISAWSIRQFAKDAEVTFI
ncbi:MAG: sugar phosphate isomerase/epimerase [Eubacteriales bacterium]|nr:sugar phosphate isomerase/epimerase [Eubacteriales bacterium]